MGRIPRRRRCAGYQVANLKSNAQGMVDIAELERMVDEDTAALMLTNPSTIGVFESEIHKIADILHAKGALLYMDGANMNALVGKTRPGDFGVDVMHLNLHKTFSTPHGGGGPGSGPVACKKILEPFLPTPVLVTRAGGALWVRLRPAAERGARAGVLRQLRHVCAGAGVHPGERAGRAAADDRGRGAECELHSRQAGGHVRAAVYDADAA
jgi:glycine cleavage system protein P-like pyridoxal-binding family